MELIKYNQERHGFHGTAIYNVWSSMVKRCENEKCEGYQWYGARGIKVCDEWRLHPGAFCEWALANGYRRGLEIDRIDVNGDYCPENCQFISHKENCAPSKRRLRKTNKTGERNICMTRHGTFESYAYINGKQKYLGAFKTLNEAVRKRDEIESSAHDNPELLEVKS